MTVVRAPDFAEEVDWSSWYLTDEDDMGQAPKQSVASRIFQKVARARADELGMSDAFIEYDGFFAWVPSEPLVRVSPDVYLLLQRPEPLPDSFQIWLPGHVPPTLALEIVSTKWKKDYDDAPEKYAQLGAAELVIFDPLTVEKAASGPRPLRPERFALQVYRRTPDGLFLRTYAGDGPAFIQTLQAWGIITRHDGVPVLSLSYDEAGRELVPTHEERAIRERDEAARERDEERARRMAVEARLAELEATLK